MSLWVKSLDLRYQLWSLPRKNNKYIGLSFGNHICIKYIGLWTFVNHICIKYLGLWMEDVSKYSFIFFLIWLQRNKGWLNIEKERNPSPNISRMPKKLINKNEKKKIEKKNQRSLHTGTYQTKNKKSLSIPKKSNSKTQEKITKESKNKKFRGKIIHKI